MAEFLLGKVKGMTKRTLGNHANYLDEDHPETGVAWCSEPALDYWVFWLWLKKPVPKMGCPGR